ncbi:MAG: T9SS type A sorting domain-containing protein [Bacteroidia bacterium]
MRTLTLLFLVIFPFTPSLLAQITFEKKIPHNNLYTEKANSVVQLADGGFAIAGVQHIWFYVSNGVYVKTDSLGNVEDKVYYGTMNPNPVAETFCNSILKLPDENLLMAGTTWDYGLTDFQAFLMKVTPQGDTLWRKYYGGNKRDLFNDVALCSDGGYIAVGASNSWNQTNYMDVYIVKTDSNGDTLWTKHWGHPDPLNIENAFAVIESYDGGYLITGSAEGNIHPQEDLFIQKISATGDSLWLKFYEFYPPQPPNASGSRGYDLIEHNTNIFVVGYAAHPQIGLFLLLLKVEDNGNQLGFKTFMPEHVEFFATGLCKINNTFYLVANGAYEFNYNNNTEYSGSVRIIAFNEDLDSLWRRDYNMNPFPNSASLGNSISACSDGGLIVAGYTFKENEPTYIYLIKTDSMGCVSPGCHLLSVSENTDMDNSNFHLYPNPAHSYITIQTDIVGYNHIEFILYDTMGRPVITEQSAANNSNVDVSKISSGIYFYTISLNNSFVQSGKLVIAK